MKKFTILDFFKLKERNEPIVMVTAYDYVSARMADEAGVDAILVGDSLSMVIQGNENTLPCTIEDMIYHTKIVKKGVKNAFLIADMPFLSYQVSEAEAIRNAGLLIKVGAEAVKIEGGREVAELVRKLTNYGIPVMGHLGMTPQHVHSYGGYKLQAKTEKDIEHLLQDAKILEEAGAFSIVLEMVPAEVAKRVTETVKVPTIGIGAGPYCDGQVLVFHDLLGLYPDFRPSFARVYKELYKEGVEGLKAFREEVKTRKFPDEKHFFKLKRED
uniref:3-methyl-2-oxobutanoate hydroxymethyltransferase n=1 Tax=candidate division WOR-3 bacterium TaxID=2052148 RepID=A0A7C2P294_UNCW3